MIKAQEILILVGKLDRNVSNPPTVIWQFLEGTLLKISVTLYLKKCVHAHENLQFIT